MKRQAFIAGLGGAGGLAIAAHAQQGDRACYSVPILIARGSSPPCPLSALSGAWGARVGRWRGPKGASDLKGAWGPSLAL
jgi:hypothetical protein